MSSNLPDHYKNLIKYLKTGKEVSNRDLILNYFRKTYRDKFRRESDACQTDGYVEGLFVLELKGNSGGFGFPKPTASMVKFYGDKDIKSDGGELIKYIGNSGGFGFVKSELSSDSTFSDLEASPLNPSDNLYEIYEGLERLEEMNDEEFLHFSRKLFILEESIGLDVLGLSLEEFLKIKRENEIVL